MIKQLNIENFQSHKLTQLEFDKGINVILGQSDSGKSAIIRALNWICFNKPNGDAFRSDWGGDTRVELYTYDNIEVVRNRTNSKNQYWLGNSEFNNVGTEVPEEILKALNMTNVNVQNQLENLFLLSSTPGEVAKHFNKIANLHDIDRATSFINKSITIIKSNQINNKKLLENKKTELRQYDYLDEAEKLLIEVESLENDRNELMDSKNSLEKVIANLKEVQASIESLENDIEIEPVIDGILTMYKNKNELTKEMTNLEAVIKRQKRLSKIINNSSTKLEALPVISEVLKLKNKHVNAVSELNKLKQLSTYINKTINAKNTLLKQIPVLEKEIKENMPDVCPICETILNDEKKKN